MADNRRARIDITCSLLLRRRFSKQTGNDRNQDGGKDYLRDECQPEAPTRRLANEHSSSSTQDAEKNRHETANWLHGRNQNARNSANNDSDEQATEETVDVHGASQPLQHLIQQAWQAERCIENISCGNRL